VTAITTTPCLWLFADQARFTSAAAIVWAVFSPSAKIAPGSLAGTYAGPSASATAGVGANVLIGGSNKTISLQPVSIEDNTGLNVAAGIAGITLHGPSNNPLKHA
jgi:hypothetical protein